MKNFFKNKKILITGGAGFIGSNLANHLNDLGSKVFVIDNLERGKKKDLNKGIKFSKLDLRVKNINLKKIFKGKDIVIHLASKVGGMQYYQLNQFDVMKDNILIDNNVIELSIQANVQTFLYASSSHVYPHHLQTKRINILKESDSKNTEPIISYGWAKLIGEKQVNYVKEKFKNSIIARFVGIYGKNQDTNILNGSVIPVLCFKSIKYPRYGFKLLTNGKEIRSYCHIDDTISAIEKILYKTKEKKFKAEIYNICSNENMTILQIAKQIAELSNKKIKVKITRKKANIAVQICSNNKIIKQIGWKPKINFINGLKSVFEDVKEKYE